MQLPEYLTQNRYSNTPKVGACRKTIFRNWSQVVCPYNIIVVEPSILQFYCEILNSDHLSEELSEIYLIILPLGLILESIVMHFPRIRRINGQ